MTDTIQQKRKYRDTLLVFNCHEPWVYQLGSLDFNLDIVVGLKGRYHCGWDYQMRPVPANARLVELGDAVESKTQYYCIITNNITDLMDVKYRDEPKIIALHSTLQGRVDEEGAKTNPQEFKDLLHKYLDTIAGHAVATSPLKSREWDFTDDVVILGVNPQDYYPHTGDQAAGLRICNFIDSRRKILLWELHEKAFDGLPVKIVGHNPAMPGVKAADNWEQLKMFLQQYRFYIHTADPQYEEGFNMAVAEAMAAGLPVIGNKHPSSPVKHGINGFLSDSPQELRQYAMTLLNDKNLANLMGANARKTALEQFPILKFKESFTKSIETARKKHS